MIDVAIIGAGVTGLGIELIGVVSVGRFGRGSIQPVIYAVCEIAVAGSAGLHRVEQSAGGGSRHIGHAATGQLDRSTDPRRTPRTRRPMHATSFTRRTPPARRHRRIAARHAEAAMRYHHRREGLG